MLRLTDSHRFSSSVFISAYLLLLINIAVASTDRYDVHVPSAYIVRLATAPVPQARLVLIQTVLDSTGPS